MIDETALRHHLGRDAIASEPMESGLAVVFDVLPHTVKIAPPGAQIILGVSRDKADTGGEMKVGEGHDILPVKRDPAFTAAVARGDRLGVGAGGRFVLADGAPGVVIVQQPEPGPGGDVLVEVAPFATTLVGTTLVRHDVVVGEEGPGGVVTIPLGFIPVGPLIQRFNAANVFQPFNFSYAIIPGPPVQLQITGANPQPAAIGDHLMIFVRE